MPAKGEAMGSRRKVYSELPGGIRVPYTEVALTASSDGEVNPPVRLYDTSGPGSEPTVGLPGHRRAWIEGRGDVETIPARPYQARDDGRGWSRHRPDLRSRPSGGPA